jgi:hypothetical protein
MHDTLKKKDQNESKNRDKFSNICFYGNESEKDKTYRYQ